MILLLKISATYILNIFWQTDDSTDTGRLKNSGISEKNQSFFSLRWNFADFSTSVNSRKGKGNVLASTEMRNNIVVCLKLFSEEKEHGKERVVAVCSIG